MLEFKNKSDYSVSAFNAGGFLVKMAYADDLVKVAQWLDASRNYSSWTYINVYARRSGRFMFQYWKASGHPLPRKPR